MDQAPPPLPGTLISILQSQRPLTQELVASLVEVAFALYQTGQAFGVVDGPHAQGKVFNKNKEVLLGALGGPLFEARLQLLEGQSTVLFFLTRSGCAFLKEREKTLA
ncbi:MAG: hypothetical protein FWG75_07865 [Cystobacterineae bacterium]|nr:hypothetical protein [Cystobacterineae bacterium]